MIMDSMRLKKGEVILNLILKNFLYGINFQTKKGFLVPNFLNSNLDSSNYADKINPNNYNPFNLVLFEQNTYEFNF